MVLEDLAATGCRFPATSDPDIEFRINDIVDQLGALHAAYWDTPRFAEGHDLHWLTLRNRRTGGVRRFIELALAGLGDEMGPTFRRLAEIYIDRAEDVGALWNEGVHTVVHGDTHIGNLYVEPRNRTGFLDWAVICSNTGVRDVAYTICNSLPEDVRQWMERPLIDRYRARLAEAGVVLDAATAWDQYRLHAVYSWVSAAATAAMGSKWQPIELGMRATRLTTAACEQIGSVELLEELLA